MSRIGETFGSLGEPNVGIIHRPVRVKDLRAKVCEAPGAPGVGVCYPCNKAGRQLLARPADLLRSGNKSHGLGRGHRAPGTPGVGSLLGTVAKLAMRQPFVLFKGLTFQKLCLPGAFRPGDHHNKMLRPGLCVVHASPQYL